MGTLLDFDKDKTIKGKKRKRNRRKFMFMGQPVCKKFFVVVYATGSKSLKNIMKHMTDNGPVPRAHGNSGKRMPHGLVFEDIKAAVQFIVNYADINGLPQPAAPVERIILHLCIFIVPIQKCQCTKNTKIPSLMVLVV